MVAFVTVPVMMAEAGFLTIQELSFVAGRIEKPSAGISKDRLSRGHWAATQANLLGMLRVPHATMISLLSARSRHALASRTASSNAIIALT